MAISSLVIGLGGTGGRVLKELRKRMFDEGLLRTDGHHQLPIAFMYIDSTDELMHQDDPSWLTLDGHNAQFSYNEFLNIGTIQPATIIEHLDYYPTVKDFVGMSNPKMFMYSGPATGQKRRIGRILFAANAQHFHNMLQEKGHELSMTIGQEGPQHIYIVTSLAGGTGSGAVVDVIAQTHKRYPHADIFVMVALPMIPPPNGHDQGRYFANVYAALKELNALNVGAFKPLDVLTSGQRVDTNNQEILQFTLIPFENGSIADCLHSFLTINPQEEYAECFYRAVSYYASGGRGHWLQWEYSAIEPEKEKPVRTLALASYAQKTIVYPKDLILQRISYSMLAQFMRQMRFNNYCNKKGYDNAGAHTYAYYRMITNSMHEVWHIDNKSLTLQHPFSFIPHDNSRSFQDEWELKADYFYHDAVELKRSTEERFNYLGELYKDYYHKCYRNYGVEGYFKDKISDTYYYVQEICHIIQHDLFMRWYLGEYGIIDLIEIVRVVVDYLRDENENANKRIEKYNEQSVKCREEMESVRKDFDNLTIFLKALRFGEKYLHRYNECLKEYYICLTHIHSIEFEKHLLDKLINRLLEQENRLMTISSKFAEMEEEANRIAEELRKESEDHHNTHSLIVDLSNEDAIQCCIDKLIADKDEMERLSTLLRQKMAKRNDDLRQLDYLDGKALFHYSITTKSDIEAFLLSLGKVIVNQEEIKRLSNELKIETALKYGDSDKVPLDINFVLSIMTANERDAYMESKEEIVRRYTYNNPFYEDTFTALLHRNVINSEQVRQFAYECISKLGVPIQLNEAELMKVVPNNPLPGPNIGNTNVFVRLPKSKTGEEERLSQELENAFRAASPNIHVGTAELGDEITIISLRTKFPIRAIEILPQLRQQYDWLMSRNNNKEMVTTLHIEDSFANLPSLEVEDVVEQPESEHSLHINLQSMTEHYLEKQNTQHSSHNNLQSLCNHNNLIIGLGGTGGRVLRELKEFFQYPLPKDYGVEFLYIDSSIEYADDFNRHEFYNICTDIKRTGSYNGILSTDFGQTESSAIWNNIKPIAEGCTWVENWTVGGGAKQNRRAGRMMFGSHMLNIDRYFYDKIRKLHDKTGFSPDLDLNVYIVSHLSGGTGSGSLVDMIILIKSYYRNAQINVIGILPSVPPPMGHDVGRYLANAYAALMELDALNRGMLMPIDITTGVRNARPFLSEKHANLFSLMLFKTDDVADTLYHLITLSYNNNTRPFIDKYKVEPLCAFGFSKLEHPHEVFEMNFSYDGSAERHIWRKFFNDADCQLVVEGADYIRLACAPYSPIEKDSFAPALKFMNRIYRNNQEILIDDTKCCDEISMLSLCYGYKLHTINIMGQLRKQYDQLISIDKSLAISMLHIEDECAELSDLKGEMVVEEKKAPYILLAMAMDILCKDYDINGDGPFWVYKTIGFLPDGTPAKGTFCNMLRWLNPKLNFIYEHEIPAHLWNYIKRDVDKKIVENKDNTQWKEKIQKSLDKVSYEAILVGVFEKEDIISGIKILNNEII